MAFLVQFEGDDADGRGIFYHTKRTRELDELLGDVYHKILGEKPFETGAMSHSVGGATLDTRISSMV